MAINRRNFPSLGTGAAAIAQLVKWLRWAEEEIATGKVNQAWNDGDASATKWIDQTLPPERRRDLILNDLGILDPTNYPPRETARITRTVSRFIC